MSVTVEPKAFHTALSRATAAIRPMKGIPILLCVRITASDGEMLIEATDLDMAISLRIPAQGECAPVCIEYRRLLAIVGTIKDKAELRLDPANDTATLSAGRSRFSVATLSPEGWPTLTEQKWDHAFDIEGPAFARLLTALAPAISTEATRYYLNGIHLSSGFIERDGGAGSLLAVATDGHKLYARSLPAPQVPAKLPGMIVPTLACAAIAKLFGEAKQIRVSCNDKKLQAVAGEAVYITKLIEGHFPDWRRVAPLNRESTCSYDLKDLVASARIVAAGAESGKGGKAIKVTLLDNETELLASDTQNPQFSGTDTVRHTVLSPFAETVIGVNVDYLIEMLEHLDAETAELAIQGAGDPILIRAAALTDRVVVIMPMRV